MTFTSRVSIVGGGIAGLTAALALAQRNIPVTLFEQSTTFREVGAGIQLSPNACAVLQALGLLDQSALRAVAPSALVIRHYRHPSPLASIPLQTAADGVPYLHVHRADLVGLLARAAAEHPLIRLHTGKRVERIEHLANGAALFTGQGERFASHWLLGADGIHSKVQSAIVRDAQPRFTGQTAWRALIPTQAIPEHCRPSRDTHLWLGPGAHIVLYYVRGGDHLNLVAVTEQPHWREESWTLPAEVEELQSAFSHWHPSLQALLAQIPPSQCFRWALFDRPPFQPWFRQRALVLGDAAHPTLPFLAQGAAMSMEDAWVFAELLGRYPQSAGERFFQARFARTAALQRRASRQAWAYHARWLPLVMARNVALSAGGRLAPQWLAHRLGRHFDWRPHDAA